MLNKLSRKLIILVLGLAVILFAAVSLSQQSVQPSKGDIFQGSATAAATISATPTTAVRPVFTPTPVPAVSPQPTETPKKVTLVWSKEAPRLYLRQTPDGLAIGLLDNGVRVTTGEQVDAGGQTWTRVTGNGIEGWVASSLIYTLETKNPILLVSGEEGAFLRSEPEGRITALLPHGTPAQVVETTDVNGITWAHVVLPDESSGWIVQKLLETAVP